VLLAIFGGSSDRRDGGSTAGEVEEEEEEVPMRDEEVDVVGMERKQMIVDVLVLPLPLLPKQKKKKKMVVITVNDLAVAVECGDLPFKAASMTTTKMVPTEFEFE